MLFNSINIETTRNMYIRFLGNLQIKRDTWCLSKA